MKSPLVVLIGARARVAAGWCKLCNAQDFKGNACYPTDKKACKWDILGALSCSRNYKEAKVSVDPGWLGAMDYLMKATGSQHLAEWNDADGRTQADVVAAFDKAIELARKDEDKQVLT